MLTIKFSDNCKVNRISKDRIDSTDFIIRFTDNQAVMHYTSHTDIEADGQFFYIDNDGGIRKWVDYFESEDC